ncbi:MAG TPA: cyclic nucleotide-binding domain-containing protein [Methylocella sp.]|nr:cyclic nucleotide-binding domain-containing protein [Methylocella sp.]
MTTLHPFKKGDLLFQQGDMSDHVLRVRSGVIEVLREIGASSFLLGHVRGGEWLGEMGVIEGRCRSATARAAVDGEIEVLTAQQFLERVSSDPGLAQELILRLSIRLRSMADRMAEELLPFGQGHSQDRTGQPALDSVIAADAAISLTAQSEALRARIGRKPIPVAKLPFVVGRIPAEGEARPARQPDLMIGDEVPFRLSRHHFVIARSGDQLLVSDLKSALGTIVNGQAIGHHFMKDTAPLHPGENRIVAGGLDSPFQFLVSIG